MNGVPLFDGGQCRTASARPTAKPARSILRTPPYDAMPGARALEDARPATPRHLAVTDDRHVRIGLALLNAESFHAFGPPVLQVGSEHRTARRRSGQRRPHAHQLRAEPRRGEQRASTSPDETRHCGGRHHAPVGWWHSTSERGGGIALWLDLLAHFSAHPPRRPLVFTANTGHELGHVGMQRFLDVEEALVRAHCWVHLGANFAAPPGQIRIRASSAALAGWTVPWNERVAVGARTEVEHPTARRETFMRGKVHTPILGSNSLFHHPEDRGPTASISRARSPSRRRFATRRTLAEEA